MRFRRERARRSEPVLDLTPLIDATFLVLVFFLVTASFTREKSQAVVPVELPSAASGDGTLGVERATLWVDDDGTVRLELDDRVILGDAAALRMALDAFRAANPDAALYLRGDESASYGSVMTLLDMAREAGFEQIVNVVYAPE